MDAENMIYWFKGRVYIDDSGAMIDYIFLNIKIDEENNILKKEKDFPEETS